MLTADPPNSAPTLGYGKTIVCDPLGWALNRTGDQIDVPVRFAIGHWALIRNSVLGPKGGL